MQDGNVDDGDDDNGGEIASAGGCRMKMGRRETPFLAPRNAARFNNGKHAHSYLCIHPQCKPAILLYFCTHMYSSTVRSPRMPKYSRARMKGEILQTPSQWRLFKQSVSSHSSSVKVFVCCVVLHNIQAECSFPLKQC